MQKCRLLPYACVDEPNDVYSVIPSNLQFSENLAAISINFQMYCSSQRYIGPIKEQALNVQLRAMN